MQHKLRVFLCSLIFLCGGVLLTQQKAFGQATVEIDEVKNSCGTQNNGSFRITVTAGTGPFQAIVVVPSTSYFAVIDLTLGVPEVVGVPPPITDIGLPPDNNILVTVNDFDLANPNFSTTVQILSNPEITGITTTSVNSTDITCLSPNGSITINTISGGSGDFDFSWTGPNGFTATTQNISNLSGGDYVVTVTDRNANCSFTSNPITITDPMPSPFTISSADLAPCANSPFTVNLSLAEASVDYELYVDGNPTGIVVTGPVSSLVHPGLPAGPHTISVQATMGLCSPIFSTNSLNFNMDAGPTSAVLSGDALICAGSSTDLVVTITGGTVPYTITIDNGVGTINNYVSGTPIPVSPGASTTYQLVGNVIDANGCPVAGTGSAAVTVNPPPTATISGGGEYCVGGALPTVTFTFTGAAPFSFTYTDGTTPVTINNHNALTFEVPNAPVGTYSITALTDNNGCPGTSLGTPVAVSENPLPTASTSGGGTVCAGDPLPGITFTFTGEAPFDFTYTDGTTLFAIVGHNNTTFTIPNAPAGAYSVKSVTDANGCVATDLGGVADVIVNPLPTATISGGGSYCEGSVAPTVTFTFTGTAPFDFTYTDGVTPVSVTNHMSLTFEVTNPAVGTYSITALSDNNGCVATALGTPVNVSQNPRPTAAVSGGGTVCADGTLPDVTFTFTGTAPFDFTYTDGTTPVVVAGHGTNTFTINNAAAGTYSLVSLTDGNGCVATNLGGSANVVVNALPTAVVSGGGAVCAGDPLPSVTFTFTGTAPFDFTYTNGVSSVTINNHNFNTFTITTAAAGNYAVTALTDDNGCVATDLGTPVAVVQNPLPTAASSGGGTVCAGDVLPDVTFTFTGTAPFTFTYTDGTTPVTVNNHNNNTFTLVNAPAGSYRVTALTDVNGCVATSLGGTTNVVVNTLPEATISGGGAVCDGSALPSVTFTFTGAIPFDFTYTDGTNTFTINDNSTTFTIPNAAPGTYSITALADNNGCVATNLGTPVVVVENPLPTAVVSGGGMACVGGDAPEVTFTFTGTAPYNFTYTDGTGTFTINNHNTNTFVIADAVAGTYSVTALTDANGCAAVDFGGSVDVVISALPTAVISGGGAYCEGGAQPTVTFTFTGALPFDFTYTDGVTPVAVNGHNSLTFEIPNAPAGTYSITALTDANGCAATDLGTPVNVVETPLPTAAASGGGAVCTGDVLPDVTFTFTGTAPFDFTYTDGTTPVTINGHNSTTFTIANAAEGSYSVTALTDANGCVATTLGSNVDVIVNELPTAAISGGGAYCVGDPSPTVTFTFTGAIPFDFTYTDGTTPVTITGHNALTFDIPNAPAGTYSITSLTDNNGCAATSLGTPVIVTENPLPTAAVSGGGVVCQGDALPDVVFTFTGVAPFDFTYTDGTTPVTINGHTSTTFTITNAPAGNYSVTALNDSIGCAATSLGGTATVTVEPAPTVNAGNAQMICGGETISLIGSSVGGSATTGAWSIIDQPVGGDGLLSDETQTANPSAVTFTASVQGVYTLRLTTDDPAGVCVAVSSDVLITVTNGATVDAGPVQTICQSDVATLAATASGTTGTTWTTSGDGTFDDASLLNAQYTPGPNDKLNGTVTLTITTGGPCAPVSDDVVITIVADPTVDAGTATTICSTGSVVLNGSFGGSATGLVWSTSGDGSFDDVNDPDATYTPGINDAAAGTVTLTATTTGTCAVTDVVTITINPAAVVDAGNDQSVCIGNTIVLNAQLAGSAATLTWTSSGDGSFSNPNDPGATYTPGPNDITNGSVILTATTNNPPGPCPAATDNVVITFIPLPGDQTTAGVDTWIGYVYDDSGDAAPYPGRVDFNTTKYRGYIEATDIAGMSPASSYHVALDTFDLNLDSTNPLQGPNVCGSYLNEYSIRYKMSKTFTEGVYRFTVGSNDGVRLLIDGVEVIPAAAFNDQSYTLYTTAPICLSGSHLLEIQYYDNTGESRLSFEYEAVPALSTNGPLALCVDSPAPVLTASTPDPDVLDFIWYKDGALVFTGANYTPSAAELDMTTASTTTFTVRAVYACGEGPEADVVVNILNSATVDVTPQTICESGGVVDLTAFVNGVPAGGTFVFSGHANITGNNFDPSGLAGSTIPILVDYSIGSCTASQATLNITVTDIATVTVPTTAQTICEASGPIDLTAFVSAAPSGGTFTFSGPQVAGSTFDPSGLSGIQTITVDYSVGGCAATPVTFDIDVATTATLVAGNANACQNGGLLNLLPLAVASPAGGTFTFTGPGVTGNMFNPVGQTGVVNIAVNYDFNGCTANGIIQVTVLAPDNPLCIGGNCATVVIVPKTEPATCTNSDGRMVMSIKPFTPAVNNTGVRITIDGISSTGLNITRTIYNDSVFNMLPVGNYTYTIEYGDPSCIKTGLFSIDQSGTVGTPIVSNIVSPICAGTATGSVVLDVPGETGNILEWSLDGGLTDPFKPFTAGTAVTGIPAGPAPTFQQVISVRRNAGDVCYSSVTFAMPETAIAINATFDLTPATCNGNDGAITGITPSGGSGGPYTFSIDGGQTYQTVNAFNGLAGGNYTIRVRDASGCEQDFAATVVFPGFINSVVSKTDADCTNGGESGSISVTVTDAGIFQVALTTDPLNPPADNQYVPYNDPSTTFTQLPKGQYFVYVRSGSAICPTRSAPINILGVYDITFDLVPNCVNNELSLSLNNVTGEPGGAPLEIEVKRKLSTAPPEVIYKQFPTNGEIYLDHDEYAFLQTPGEYTIRISQFQSEAICVLSSEIYEFVVTAPLSVQIGSVSQSYPDVASGEITVTNFVGGAYPYLIRIELDSASSFMLPFYSTQFEEPGVNNNQQLFMRYSEIPAGRYSVEVRDANGCMLDLIARVPLDKDLFIPNIFTPNGDGLNDVFFIRNLPEGGNNQLIITNRWGKQVFVSENYQNNWDGGDAADGVYFYRLKVGGGEAVTGWVEILRGAKP
jgi:gliding motility-associated-like protein